MSTEQHLTASVVIPTMNRPEYVRTCLEHLGRQTVPPQKVVVVDASPDTRTRDVVAGFAGVEYLRNPKGAGATATSRRIGSRTVTSDVVAFVDDDAYAATDWLERLLAEYADPQVGGVGGRVDNGRPGEEKEGLDAVGRLLDDGRLTGHFAADTGRAIEVDHFLGANMSFRRAALESFGGIHEGYPGPCLREETDIAFRTRRAGWRLVFTPTAVVRHDEGPYVKGRRFDTRYMYYGQRNHLVLLLRTVGVLRPQTRRFVGVVTNFVIGELVDVGRAVREARTAGASPTARRVARRTARAGAAAAGLVSGIAAGLTLTVRDQLTR
ncbi:MAG: glycosyltransferase family 2 protein [Promicromonosporaceae bacterium]|nr:glycosyltransferase family 2 protein [Promicromonosporaceae bacterium]